MPHKKMTGKLLEHSMMVDTAICHDCLSELFNPRNRRYLYPYIGCASCGPKYTVMKYLPFNRENTTMEQWQMCPLCQTEYEDATDKRFQAELNCCPQCGPNYFLYENGKRYSGEMMFKKVVELLLNGEIIAVKNIGGYHLVCDAKNKKSVQILREKLHRKRKPFAMMVKNMEVAETIVQLSKEEKEILLSDKRPIVLAKSKGVIDEIVAPNNMNLGIMLPYTALHHLLFYFGAPNYLIMTSANYPGEPTIHQDEQIFSFAEQLNIACLVGERAIERSIDDSVVKKTKHGTLSIRKSRGYETIIDLTVPIKKTILTVGADLKNTITLINDGKIIMSHHLGDLTKYHTQVKFEKMVKSFIHMFDVSLNETIIGHDLHPSYFTSQFAIQLNGYKHVGIQHHKAHLASVLATNNEFSKRIIGIVFDGTGYGDHGEIWGGEIFVGSIHEDFKRIGHLRNAVLIGGDAAALNPVQALAGFINENDETNTLINHLQLPDRFSTALKIKEKNLNCYPTTSIGRLFDAVAAILGFHRDISFEGEAAIWLETIATEAPLEVVYDFPWTGKELDYRPLLNGIIEAKLEGYEPSVIARGFHRSVAKGVVDVIVSLSNKFSIYDVVLSGGVFQNNILVSDISALLQKEPIQLLFNEDVPVNDSGISLGQAVMIASQYVAE